MGFTPFTARVEPGSPISGANASLRYVFQLTCTECPLEGEDVASVLQR